MTPAKQQKLTVEDALPQLETALRSGLRAEIVEMALRAGGFDAALGHLRKAMRSHMFPTASGAVTLRRMVDTLDARTRREGMHVLQGWDFVAHRFPKDIAPVLLLDYCARLGIPPEREGAALAILLDQYLLALLSLAAIRAWDDGDANVNLDRITAALADLQGSQGSAQQWVADAETLLMLAVSYFHPEEQGYDLLLQRVSELDDAHQQRFACACAAMLGGHLRWGLRFMYERDVGRMRDDNVADYPLLLFALRTLARADALGGDQSLVEALLSGFSSDPWAFTGERPAAFAAHQAWYDEVRAYLAQHRTGLLSAFAPHQPSPRAYSPLSFSYNFPTNATVAMVALAVQRGSAHPAFNALFVSEPEESGTTGAARAMALQLMEFAASAPERLGARGTPLIVYDPFHGAHCYNTTIRTLGAG